MLNNYSPEIVRVLMDERLRAAGLERLARAHPAEDDCIAEPATDRRAGSLRLAFARLFRRQASVPCPC